MESWLRRYAEKRRQEAGPPFELHSADKERLLTEVRRVYSSRSSQRRAWWAIWTLPAFPRLGYAAALVLVLGIATYFLWLTQRQGPEGATHLIAKQTVTERQDPSPSPKAAAARMLLSDRSAAEKKKEAENVPSVARMERASEPLVATRSAPAVSTVRTTEPTQAAEGLALKREEKDAAPSEPAPARYVLRGGGDGDRQAGVGESENKTVLESRSSPLPAPAPATALPPALAMRGAPSPVKPADIAVTRGTPPQPADVQPTTLLPQTNTLLVPKAAPSLADFYLAQQTTSQDRPLDLAFLRGRESTAARADSVLFQSVPSGQDGKKPVVRNQTQVKFPANASVHVSREDMGVRYVVSAPPSFHSPPAVFYLWVTNDILRLKDSDGVVYEGRLNEVAPAPASRNQLRTADKAGARELLMSSPTRRTAPVAGRVTAVQGTRQFELMREHPRLQQKVIISGQWPPHTNGILRLQMRIGEGPVQTLLAKPAEN